MTAEDLMTRLIADIRRIEHEGQRRDAHRRMVVHCMNETMAWIADQARQAPQQPQGAGEGRE